MFYANISIVNVISVSYDEGIERGVPMNKLREKLQKGQKTCGALVSLTDPCLCEIMGVVGYDYVWVDMEHTYISEKEVLCHLNAARAANTSAIVRLPQDDLTVTKKILEMGPEGIIFPMVRSVQQVKDLIATTLYPPLGTRGFGPMRAIGYGAVDTYEYVSKASLELCRFIQIEHIDCVDALEELAENPYIDGFIFGPNDLSGSLGALGDVFGEATLAQIRKAIDILQAKGKYIGLATGDTRPETIRFWSELGVQMLTVGADWNFVYNGAKKNLMNLRAFHLKEEKI